MSKNEILKASKHLVFVERGSNYVAYHSLYGGLCILDAGAIELLKRFEQPKSIKDAFGHRWKVYLPLLDVFKHKYFLTTPEIDEYASLNKKYQQRKETLQSGRYIGVIQLVVTNLCNFKCTYCFANTVNSSDERRIFHASPDNRFMSIDIAINAIEKVVKTAKNSENNSLHIQFFGGEPLMNWPVIKAVLEKFGSKRREGFEFSFSIVTNGSLINEEVAFFFKKYNVPVIVSFDSPKTKDRLDASGKADIAQIEDGLQLLKRYKNRVVFNSVLSMQTFDYFDTSMVDYALSWSVSEIGVLLDLDPQFYENKTKHEIVDKLFDFYLYAKENGIVVTGYWHKIFQQIVDYEYFEDFGYKTCSATGCQLSIEPSGHIFACKGSSGYFGEISNLDKLFLSERYRKYAMRAYRNAPECAGCEIENFCSGICLGPLEKKYNDIYVVEKNTCDVYKEITKRLIQNVDTNLVDVFTIGKELRHNMRLT